MNRFQGEQDSSESDTAPAPSPGQGAEAQASDSSSETASRPSKPLRQFRHAPVEPLPSPWRIRLQQSAFWLVPLLVVLFVGMIGVAIALKSSMSRGIVDHATTGSSLFEAPPVSTPSKSDPAGILASHLEAIGGRAALANLRSMAISGRIDDGRDAYSAQIFGVKPAMSLLSFNLRDGQLERHYRNGTTTWRLIQDRGKESLSELNVREILALDAMSRLLDPLAAIAIEGTGLIASARETRYMGRNVHELKIDRFDGSEVICYVEEASYHLIGSRELRTIEGKDYEIEMRMSDFRMASGILRPHATIIRIDGELYTRVFADSIRYNSGVMSSVFDLPSGLAP